VRWASYTRRVLTCSSCGKEVPGEFPHCPFCGAILTPQGIPEAAQPLREARDLFASMSYKPALTETEALLGESEAAAV
jgi:predicted amidophosphoribosyltransferase